MNRKTGTKIRILFIHMASIALLGSCASYKDIYYDKQINIEKIDSIKARITHANLYKTAENKTVLHGQLKKRGYRLGQIPGHLDIELINLEGRIFKKAQINYSLRDGKLGVSLFSILIPADATSLSSIRVIHHNAGLHKLNSKVSPWQDIISTSNQ